MAISPMSFPMLTFEQANPFMAAQRYQAGTTMQQALAAQEQLKAQYAPQTMAEQLKQMQSQTEISKAQAQYAMPYQQALAATQQMMPAYYGATIEDIEKGKIPLEQAQAGEAGARSGLYKEQAKYTPYTAAGEYYSGLGKFGTALYQNNPATAVSRMMNTPQFQSLYQTNPEFATQIAQTIANVGQRAGQGVNPFLAQTLGNGGQSPIPANAPQLPGMTGGNPILQNAFQPQMVQQQQQMPQSEQYQASIGQSPIQQAVGQYLAPSAASQLISSITGVQQNTPQQQQMAGPIIPSQVGQQVQPVAFTPEDIARSQVATGNVLEKKQTTGTILNQRQYASMASSALDDAAEYLPDFAKYVGLIGHAEKTLEGVKSVLGGKNSIAFQNYNKFIEKATFAAADLRRGLGSQATDLESKKLENLTKPDYWYSNPEMAIDQWNAMMSIYKNKIEPSLAAGATQTQQKLASGSFSLIPRTSSSAQQTPGSSSVMMIAPDGTEVPVHSSRIDEAINVAKFRFKR